jgi:LacI family transcriptional regulator
VDADAFRLADATGCSDDRGRSEDTMNRKRSPSQSAHAACIGFLFDFRIGFDRSLYKATVNYRRSNPPFRITPILQPVEDLLALYQEHTIHGKIDALAGRFTNARAVNALRQAGCPLVNWVPNTGLPPIPLVASDDRAIGEMVARYFLQKGHTNFAFVGQSGDWSDQRFQGFNQALQAAGRTCTYISMNLDQTNRKVQSAIQAQVQKSISALQSGTAVMTANDNLGAIFINCATKLDIHIPADLAIIGVDDDDMACEFNSPVPLSSVSQDYDQIIRQTGELMQRLLENRSTDIVTVRVPPLAIHQRLSSEITSLGDPRLNKAMAFILQNAHRDIGIDDIAHAAGISKQALRRKFQERLRLTPHAVLTLERVKSAQNQLVNGASDIGQLAQSCGFGSPQRFYINFRKLTGMSPAQYRRKLMPRTGT